MRAQNELLNASLQRTAASFNSVTAANAAWAGTAASKVAQASAQYRAGAESTGMFDVSQRRLNDATDDYVKKLQKQKASLRDVYRAHKGIHGLANQTMRQQMALQQMTVRRAGTTPGGRGLYDITTPNLLSKELDTATKRMGFFREEMRSVANQTVNWGKNVQWAGRQLMVGFTVPVAAFGAAAGVMAYQVDKQLTRIRKVYDTTADANNTTMRGQMAVAKELAQVSYDAFQTAAQAARDYGANVKDTLEVEADLAAIGLKGAELRRATTQVVKSATLGEIDYQDALNATVAMQSVFRMDSQKTAEAWAYMNSVENATSLAMADFAKAIPIAAAPVRDFGGDIRELGLLLTAMKENGVGAVQGANALKAAMQRLGRPSKQIQEEFKAITGENIVELVDTSESLTEVFQRINEVTADLSAPEKRDVFAGLFGAYQLTRMRALIDGVSKLEDGIGQVSRAQRVGEQSAEKWFSTEEAELERFRQSISGKLMIAIQAFKAELVPIGTVFVEMASKVVNAATWLINRFNDMPDLAKTFTMWTIGIAAVAGPLVMLTGLFGNLIGQGAKFMIGLSGLGRRMELLTTDEKAAALAAEMVSIQFSDGASAANLYALQVDRLRQSLVQMNLQQGLVAPMRAPNMAATTGLPRTGKYAANYGGSYTMPNLPAGVKGSMSVSSPLPMYSQTQAKIAEDMAKNQAATAKHTATAAVGMGLFAAAAGVAMFSTNETVQKVAQIGMLAAMLGPAIMPLGRALATGADKFVTALAKGGTLLSGLKMGFVGLLTPVGALVAAITAIGAGIWLVKKYIDSGEKSVENMYADAKDLGEILNYTPIEQGTAMIDKQGQSVETLTSKAQKFRESYGDVVEQIKNAKGDQEAFNIAMSQGLKVINTGGTAEQAKEAVKVALAAAKGQARAERLILEFEARLNFDNNTNLIREQMRQSGNLIEEAFTTAASAATMSTWEQITFQQTKAMDQAEANAKQAGMDVGSAFSVAFESGTNSRPIEENLEKELARLQMRIDRANKNGNATLANQLERQQGIYLKAIIDTVGTGVDKWQDLRAELAGGADLYDLMRRHGIKLSDEMQRQLRLERERAAALKDFVGDQRRTQRFIAAGADDIEMFKLHLVNSGKAGHDVADAAEDTADGLDKAEGKAKGLTEALKDAKEAMPWDQVSDRFKEGIDNVRDRITGQWEDTFQTRMDSHMDSLAADAERQQERLQNAQEAANRRMDNRQERESRRLDDAWEARVDRAEKRWDRREEAIAGAYDARIDKINNVIKAEEKAEEARQRIFDAEISRINRLASIANQQIDFNVALNTGDLDEAAKIRNDMQAQQAEWALSDAGDRGARQADKRIERLESRIDIIEENKDKRLDALKEERDAFFKQLKDMEEREKRSLDRRHDRQKRLMDDRQEAAQKNLEAELKLTEKAAQKMWDARKDKLDEAIRFFKSSHLPANEKALGRHIRNTMDKYGGLNKDVRGIFRVSAEKIHESWVREMNAARRDISSEIDWATMGAKIGDKVIKGMWGIDRQDFYKWMVTGKFPGKKKPPTVEELRDRFQSRRAQNLVEISRQAKLQNMRHEGGPIGTGGKDSRKGVARTARSHPSEVNVLAQKGEYMIQKRAVGKYGEEFMDALNQGKIPVGHDKGSREKDPRVGGAGITGIAAAAAGAMIAPMAMLASLVGASQAEQQMTQMYGKFKVGDIPGGFDADQMKNAAVIANVGRSVGASKRDILIAFMTALVESGMRNLDYGHLDSIGMFQQRDAWGTRQARLDPKQSARMFFLGGMQGQRGLLDFANRDQMGMGEAAQAVQVSAYPGRYIEMLDEARAIWASLDKGSGAGSYVPGPGGKHRPVKGGVLTQGIHGSPPAVDIGVPIGSRLFAVGDGRITEAKSLKGYESRLANAGYPQNGYYSYGKYLVQSLDGGGSVLYAHLNDYHVRAGQRVAGGSVIGRTGNTGNSYGAHLHFGASPMTPYTFLQNGGYVGSEGKAYIHGGEAVVSPDRTAALFASLDTFERVMAQLEANSGRIMTINPSTGEPGVLRAGTYNLNNNTKNARSQADLEKLMSAADVLGLTEFIGKKKNIRNWLENKGWGVVGPHGPGGDSALAFNKMRYELLRSGGQKLNTTETSRGGGRSRYASYGLLRDKETGREFWNIVAHAVNKKGGGQDYLKIQQEQFKALQELAKNLGTGGQPVFIMGDLNTMKPKIKGFSSQTPGGIDHIMSAGMKAMSTRTVRGLSSDHPAVLAQFGFPGLAKGAANINVEGLYRLHQNEGVLTEDINRQFKQGVENFANGAGNQYNVTMQFNGDVTDKPAMRRFIINTLEGMQKRKPTNRKGTD